MAPVSPPVPEPRNLPALRPESFLTIEWPIPEAKHPVFIYLSSLPTEASERAMGAALVRVAALFGFELHQLKWWGLPARYVWSIRRRLAAEGYSAASVNQSLSAIRGVLRVAHDQGLMGDGLYEALIQVPLLPTLPRARPALPQKKVRRLLEKARADTSPKGRRDAAILQVIAGSGLKRSEVTSLRLADVDLQKGALRLGGESIRLTRDERSVLRAWISERGRKGGPLFQPIDKAGNRSERAMSGQGVADVVAARGAAARIEGLGPEDLRYTAS
jgi:integrase/recombinase XerD